jgi:hypothetical protein
MRLDLPARRYVLIRKPSQMRVPLGGDAHGLEGAGCCGAVCAFLLL